MRARRLRGCPQYTKLTSAGSKFFENRKAAWPHDPIHSARACAIQCLLLAPSRKRHSCRLSMPSRLPGALNVVLRELDEAGRAET